MSTPQKILADVVITGSLQVTEGITGSALTASSGIYTINPLADNYFLKVTGSTITGTLNGLNYFIESQNTADPNNTRPVHALTVTGTAADIDFAIIPKGQGGIIAAIPDTTSSLGPNRKRGIFSIDLQLTRSAILNDAGALGAYSTVVGGNSNRISSTSTEGAIIGGSSNFVDGVQGVALGNGNFARAANATILGGLQASTQTIGKSAYASGRISATADAQIGQLILKATTSASATPVVMTSQAGVAASNTNVFTGISTGGTVNGVYQSSRVKTDLLARDTDGNTKTWSFDCIWTRGPDPSTAKIDVSSSVSAMSSSTSASSWDVTMYANTSRGSLELSVTGTVTQNIRWVAYMNSVEMYFTSALA